MEQIEKLNEEMATLSPNCILTEYSSFFPPKNDLNFNECVGVFIATFSIIILEKLAQESSDRARAGTLLQVYAHTHVIIIITSDKHLKQ